jgi:thermitase
MQSDHTLERAFAFADYHRHVIVYHKLEWPEDNPEAPAPPDDHPHDERFDVDWEAMFDGLDVRPLDHFYLGESQVVLGYIRDPALSVSDLIQIARENHPEYNVLRDAPIALLQQTANDPLYRRQWALHKIEAAAAWRRFAQASSHSVKLAIVDSGVEETHPDLPQTVITGQNFITGGPDFSDDDGHGTLLAGTIAAVTGNSTGIAGTVPPAAGWLGLMALKFTDARTPPLAYSAAAAIAYAAGGQTAPRRADIVNASWHLLEHHDLILDSLKLARQRGVLVVAAAGNQGCDNTRLPLLPADYGLSNMISVMASDRHDDKPWFSNYGNNVDIAAPGVDILSTGLYFQTPAYREYTGTSPSTAQVSAAAAMLLSIDSSWTPSQIREHLVASAEPVRNLRGLCRANGRLNLRRAIVGPLAIVRPAGGERLQRGSIYEVRWRPDYLTPAVSTIAISINGQVLASGLANTGHYNVMLPNIHIATAVIRVASEQKMLYADSPVFKVI